MTSNIISTTTVPSDQVIHLLHSLPLEMVIEIATKDLKVWTSFTDSIPEFSKYSSSHAGRKKNVIHSCI